MQRTLAAGRAQVRARVRAARTDLALASVGGGSTQRLYAAGLTLRAGSAAASTVPPPPEPAPVPLSGSPGSRPVTGGGEATR